jgi:hypothetical protein
MGNPEPEANKMNRTDHLLDCPQQGMRWSASNCNCAFLLNVSSIIPEDNEMNWKVIHESPMERRARYTWMILRLGFIVLLLAGMAGWLSGCETVEYMNCVLKGNC